MKVSQKNRGMALMVVLVAVVISALIGAYLLRRADTFRSTVIQESSEKREIIMAQTEMSRWHTALQGAIQCFVYPNTCPTGVSYTTVAQMENLPFTPVSGFKILKVKCRNFGTSGRPCVDHSAGPVLYKELPQYWDVEAVKEDPKTGTLIKIWQRVVADAGNLKNYVVVALGQETPLTLVSAEYGGRFAVFLDGTKFRSDPLDTSKPERKIKYDTRDGSINFRELVLSGEPRSGWIPANTETATSSINGLNFDVGMVENYPPMNPSEIAGNVASLSSSAAYPASLPYVTTGATPDYSKIEVQSDGNLRVYKMTTGDPNPVDTWTGTTNSGSQVVLNLPGKAEIYNPNNYPFKGNVTLIVGGSVDIYGSIIKYGDNDVMGIVSQGDITIKKEAKPIGSATSIATMSDPGNSVTTFKVQASLMALNGKAGAVDETLLNSYGTGSRCKGKIEFKGLILMKTIPPHQQKDSTGGPDCAGFGSKELIFDPVLKTGASPAFNTSDQAIIIQVLNQQIDHATVAEVRKALGL